MFRLETVNELSLCAKGDGQGQLFTKAGAMIGYYGQCHFEKVMLGPNGNPVQALLGQIGRRLTGENIPLMKVAGRGQTVSYYACEARHVTVINLNPGQSIAVESEDLLAFNDLVDYSLKPLGIGVISQKGLFTSKLTGKAPGAQVAIMTDGNPLVFDTPCCVDPDAMVAFTGPDPGFKLDLSWKNLLGQASGESYMLEYKQPGYKVIVQPNERKSGLDIGIDNHGESQHIQQNQSFSDAMGNVGDTFNNIGNAFNGGGGNGGGLGGMLGGIFGNR
ncbi:MAG TPA: tryptophan RNA-binding attenuation protein [Ruminococcus sp.]|nr:tryptophan RNA-binding attenuation protein [Ruminococcus sp.]